MNQPIRYLMIIVLTGLGVGMWPKPLPSEGNTMKMDQELPLKKPRVRGDISLEEALKRRRSVRSYLKREISVEEVSQLLWAAQGITDRDGFRTAPSAGALYPLELYIVVSNVCGLSKGIYRYSPSRHSLSPIMVNDVYPALAAATGNQSSIEESAVVIAFTAVYERTTKKYGERGTRYVHMEVGHAAQNVFLQSEVLNLGTVVVGAFDDMALRKVLCLPADEEPLYLMPIGGK